MMEYQASNTFENYRFDIKTPMNVTHYLVFFGDVHRYSPLCSETHWKEFLQKAKRKKNSWFIGMGDYTDLLSRSERKLLRHEDAHESTAETMEDWYEEIIEKFAKELSPLRGRIIGLCEGNHTIKFLDGSTSTQRLCRKLGCKYLGNPCFVKIYFKDNRNSLLNITVFAGHGVGSGGRTLAGGWRLPEQMMNIGIADIYACGHNHQLGVQKKPLLYQHDNHGKLEVRQKEILLVRTGCYLRSYVEGRESYGSKALYPPTTIGSPWIACTPFRTQIGGKEEYGVRFEE